MNEIGFGALGGILPEIILLIGGLLILLLDMAQTDEQDSGKGFMAVTVVFLIVALVGVILQLGMPAYVALAMVDIDPFATFLKILV